MSPPSGPEVSVVIPTRNREAFARQAIASALAQEGVTLEVIVVDDASDDGSADVLASLDDPRVEVRHRVAPGGPARARNEGIAAARSRWIAFLDDDDLWSPDRLRAQLAIMERADFGYCAVILVDPARRALGTFSAPRPAGLREGLRRSCLIPGPSSVLVRAELLQALGGFRDDVAPLEDWELWIRLAAAGRAAATGDLLVAYTVHDANAHIRDPRAAIRAFDTLADAHSVHHAAPEFFAWLAAENRAAGRWCQSAEVALTSAWRHRDPEELGRALALIARRPAPDPATRPHRIGPGWLDPYREKP